MAEILLSLTIIGVVAAITLPSLTGNINERTWNTQRRALYSRMSQAIALMPALNGYGELDDTDSKNVAETFITAGLAKVLKINNICDSEHLPDCGIPAKIVTATTNNNLNLDNIKTLKTYNIMFGTYTYNSVEYSVFSAPDIKASAFETANGESILVYYNPTCKANQSGTAAFYLQEKMCVNFVYDLNGKKGPNSFGKDIGIITAFYPSDSVVVAPISALNTNLSSFGSMTISAGHKYCRENFDNARLPNREELMSMAVNTPLFGIDNLVHSFGSSSVINASNSWYVSFATGSVHRYHNTAAAIWCIQR